MISCYLHSELVNGSKFLMRSTKMILISNPRLFDAGFTVPFFDVVT